MDTTENQLEQFRQFALARLDNGGRALTLDELFDEWRLKNPDLREHADNCKAIAASLKEFDEGERGIEASKFMSDFRSRNGIK